jgi:uncharacterized protein
MVVNDDPELKRILTTARTVAMVGASPKPESYSYGVFKYLKDHGYHMIPVNPNAKEIHGEKVYPDLASLPQTVDVIQVFRRSEDVPPIVEAAIKIGAEVVWMQEGIVNEEAARKAESAGLKVVMDRCMMSTHHRLLGG